jgi:hypothetical protein
VPAIVGLTAAVDAKTAVFARLKTEAASGLLAGWAVDYAYNGNPQPQPGATQRQIYGGGWRSVQEDTLGEHGVLMDEVISVSLYLRATAKLPDAVAEDVEAMVKAAGVVIGQVFKSNPRLAGDLTWLGITTGAGDCYPLDDDLVCTHSFAMTVGARLMWGQ